MKLKIWILLLVTIGVGCMRGTYKLPYVWESDVSRSLLEFSNTGPVDSVKRLSDFTSFRWDVMHYFRSGTKKSDIDAALGIDFVSSSIAPLAKYYDDIGPLLVFKKGTEVVHAVVVTPPVHTGGRSSGPYEHDKAVVRAACSKPSGPFVLHFFKDESELSK